MLSIRLKYFYLTYKAIKKLEIRKSIPKDFTGTVFEYISATNFEKDLQEIPKEDREFFSKFKGKVGLEFTLNAVDEFKVFENGTVQYWNYYDLEKSCLTYDEISNYVGRNKIGYAWHIEDLKIYDTPKELSEFSGFIKDNKCEKHENGFDCKNCECWDNEHETCLACYYLHKQIKRPPQSWCYVEE